MIKSFDEIVLFARTGLNPRTNFKLGNGTNKYITIKNIHNNQLIIDNNTDLVDNEAIKLIHKRSQIKKGDILFASIGRMGDMYIIPDEPIGWDINESVFAFTLNTEIIRQKYFFYIFKNHNTIEYLSKNSSGSTFKSIKMNQLKKMSFDIPNLSEQDKIISLLDNLQLIITHRQKQLEKLDELIKARFVEMFGDPESNNYNWDTFKMAELCTVSSSKRVYQSELTNEGVPFLRISDLVNRMDYSTETCDLFISEEKYSDLLDNGLVPKKGDILVTARGTLGRCYIVKDTDRFYFQDGMITWLSGYSEKIIPVYISYLFSMQGIKKQIEEMQAGSTVAYLSIAMTKKLNIMLPPLGLQNQFADFVKQVDKSKVVIQKHLEKAQLLFDSLMQEYFG